MNTTRLFQDSEVCLQLLQAHDVLSSVELPTDQVLLAAQMEHEIATLSQRHACDLWGLTQTVLYGRRSPAARLSFSTRQYILLVRGERWVWPEKRSPSEEIQMDWFQDLERPAYTIDGSDLHKVCAFCGTTSSAGFYQQTYKAKHSFILLCWSCIVPSVALYDGWRNR